MGYVDGMGLKEAFGGNPENAWDTLGLFEFEVKISPGSQEGKVIAKKSSKEEHWVDLRDIFPDVTDTVFQTLLEQFHPTEETHEVDITKFLPENLRNLLRRAGTTPPGNCLSLARGVLEGGQEPDYSIDPDRYWPKLTDMCQKPLETGDLNTEPDWDVIAEKVKQGDVIVLKRRRSKPEEETVALHGMIVFAKQGKKIWVMQRKYSGAPIEIQKLNDALSDNAEYSTARPYLVTMK
jgi:hypothetical protein